MAKQFGGSRFWALGAIWWFVIAGVLGLLHRIFPGMVETPRTIIIVVVVAVIGPLLIVYLFRPRP